MAATVLAMASLPVLTAGPAAAGPDQSCVPQPGGTIASQPWAQKLLGLDRVWPITTGVGVRVAVIDTGLDHTVQPQLRLLHVADGRDVSGTAAGPTDTSDCNGHGTAVAGIIAAPRAASVPFEGVAPGVTIIPIRQTGSDGNGSTSTLAAGIDYAVAEHADVINISIHVAQSTPALKTAVTNAERHNVIIVAAAGNDGQSNAVSKVSYPAAYAPTFGNVIGVGAIDEQGQIAPFSDQGSYLSVVAPGVNVVVPARQRGYTTASGTSFATPFVTATVALLRSQFPALSPEQIRNRLEATADPPPATVPSDRYGYGTVNPYLALTSVRNDAVTLPPPTPGQPLAAPVLPKSPDRHLQHVALAAGLGLIGLAGLAGLGVLAFGRPKTNPLRP